MFPNLFFFLQCDGFLLIGRFFFEKFEVGEFWLSSKGASRERGPVKTSFAPSP
jgi:hypothetical protein